MLLPQLKRIRWAVRAALFLGVAASVAANILHARENPISQAISAWPPLALLLTVELTSRIPMHKRSLAALRVLATIAIAGIAAWVSYWHMQGVAARYGETEMSSYLLPVSVDGLIVVASVSLVELAGRIRFLEEKRAMAGLAANAPAAPVSPAPVVAAPAVPVSAVPAYSEPVPAAPGPHLTHTQALADGGSVSTAARAVNSAVVPSQPVSMGPRTPVSPLSGKPLTQHTGAHSLIPQGQPAAQSQAVAQAAPVSPAVSSTQPAYVNGSTPPPARPAVTRAAVSAPARTMVTSSTTRPAESTTPRQRRPVQETADLADEIQAMHPEISDGELARRLGISATRLRTVRREARGVRRAGAARR
ncbi:MAG: hypothetical protein QOE61_5070 [Micromonosporaceae bacterium]|nr:hypothetical protein [Micromonosporaceae bacterium]